MKPKTALRSFLAVTGSSMLAVSSSHAGQTWDGGSTTTNNWNTPDNWDGTAPGVLPNFANAINFQGNTRNGAVNDLTADTTIGGINFTNTGATNFSNAFTLSGARITLGGNITTRANTAGSTITDTISLAMILNGDRTITTNQLSSTVQHNLTISGVISQDATNRSLTKAGAGTLTLSANATNTFAGGLVINGGTLALDYANIAASTSLVADTNTLTLAGGNLTLKGKTGANATTQTLGNVTVNAGGGTLLINPNGGTSTTLTLGTIAPTVQGSSLTLGTALSAGSGTVTITTTTNKDAQDIYGGRLVFANGTANTGYDWATTASGGSPYTLSAYSGYSAMSDGTGGVTDTLNSRITVSQTQAGNLTTNSLKIQDPAASQSLELGTNLLTLTSGGLLVTGTNAVSINGTAGATRLTAGNGSGSYDLVVHQFNSGGLTIGAVVGDNGGNATSLTKSGTGALTLSGSNTFTGGLFINSGAVTLGNAGALNSTAGSENAVTIASSGTLSLNGNSVVVKSLGGSDINGTIVQNGHASTAATLTVGNSANASSTFDGVIQNGGTAALSLTKAGTGTLTLSGTNTYTGTTTISAGTLKLVGRAFNANTTARNYSISSGAVLHVDGIGQTQANQTISGNGTLRVTNSYWDGKTNGGAVTTISLGAGALIDIQSGATIVNGGWSPFTWSGNQASMKVDGTLDFADGAAVTVDALTGAGSITKGWGGATTFTVGTANGSGTFSGAISGGATGNTIALTKTGTGTQTLSGPNSYAGTTTISAGVLNIQHANALGATAAGTSVTSGAALELQHATGIAIGAEALTLNGSGISSGGALRNISGTNSYAGLISLGSATRINSDAGLLTLDVASGNAITNTQNLTFGGDGNITVADNINISTGTLTKDGTGTLTLSSTNTYTGANTVYAGTLALGHATDTLAGAVTVDGASAILSIAGNSDTVGAVSLKNGGRITGSGGTLTGSSYAVESGSVSAILGGTSVALTKTTAGTVTLTGANSYTGATTVNGGTLLLDMTGTGALASTSALTLGGGTFKVLGKSGAFTTAQTLGALTVNAGGSQIVLDSNGGTSTTLTLANSAPTRAAGGTLAVDLSIANTVLTSTLGLTADTQTTTQAVLGYATVKDATSTGFATNVGGNIVRYTGADELLAASNSSTTNYKITPLGTTTSGTPLLTTAASAAYNSLSIDTSGATGANFLSLNGTVSLTQKALLMTGGNDFTIQGGTQLGAAASEVIVHQAGTGTLTISSLISSGAGSLTKSGSGTLVLTGANAYTGATNINAGTLRMQGMTSLNGAARTYSIAPDAVLNFNGVGALTKVITVNGTGTFRISGGDFRNDNLGGNITWALGAGGLIDIQSGGSFSTWYSFGTTWTNNKATLNVDGTIQGNTGMTINADALTGSGTIKSTGGVIALNIGVNNGSGTFSGKIGDTGNTAVSLTKTGTGTQTLSGTNLYTGATAVNAGLLNVTGTLASAVTVANGATLSGTGTTTSTLALSAGSTIVGTTTGNSFRASNITATSAVTIAGSDGSGTIGSHTIGVVRYTGTAPTTANFSTAGYHAGASVANVSGETQLTYTNVARTWNSASGTWDAMTTNAWQEGDLKFGHGDAITFDDTGTGGGSARAVTLNSLVTPGSVTFNNSTSTPYTVSGTGTIAGPTGLTKSGNGTVTLSNTNTYTGATTVTGGKLVVNGNISTSILTTVQTGATLGGSGTVGALTIDAGGTFAPGNSPGIETVNGAYTQNGTLQVEIEGGTAGNGTGFHDQVVVNGTVTLNGLLDLITFSGSYVANNLIFILLNDGADAISGTFTGLAQGANVGTHAGFDWQISYTGNQTSPGIGNFTGGNDVALMAVAIPEPRAALLGGLGMLALLRRRRS